MLANVTRRLALSADRHCHHLYAASVAARWKSTFESEHVRKSTTASLTPAERPDTPLPSTDITRSQDIPVGFVDSYYDKPHLINPRDKTKRTYTYMVLGAPKFIAASMARSAVLTFIYSMSAAADVLAAGTVEVDLNNIPEGNTATIKWRGKPVFIRHRTDAQIQSAERDDSLDLRDPELDNARCKDPKWMVVLGVCTHLGCVPVSDAGDYGGWFCPCHGSHYDVSGRIRKGPAPTNLEIPPYHFQDDNMMILG